MVRSQVRLLVAVAVLLGGVALLAATAPAAAAQDDDQELEVTYEYELAPDRPDEVRVNATIENPDEVERDVEFRIFEDIVDTHNVVDDYGRWKQVESDADEAWITYWSDDVVSESKSKDSGEMIADDGSWAVLTVDDINSSDHVDRTVEGPAARALDAPYLDKTYALLGNVDAHTAHTDTATITVVGSPETMEESPQVVAEALADVSAEIEAGVLDHNVTAFAAPDILNASGKAKGSETHFTEPPESVAEGGNTWFHEYVHNTDGMANLNTASPAELGSGMTWFTEGYADYGAHLYGLRAGYGSYSEFVDDMQTWENDPPAVLSDIRTWEGNAEYDQGSRVLAAIDYELRNASRANPDVDATIDDVVREMHEQDEVDLDTFLTILREEGTNDIARKAETWITTEHHDDVFDPMGPGEFEELYVDMPELEGVDDERDIVGVHSDAQDPADPVLLDEQASTLVVYASQYWNVEITTVDGEVVAEASTDRDVYTTVDTAAFDRSTTYEVTTEFVNEHRVDETTTTLQYVSTLDPVDGTVPRDVNGDGLHRDVDGDGEVGQADVSRFFDAVGLREDAIYDHPEAYDFDGDGSVGQGDVQALFDYVALN